MDHKLSDQQQARQSRRNGRLGRSNTTNTQHLHHQAQHRLTRSTDNDGSSRPADGDMPRFDYAGDLRSLEASMTQGFSNTNNQLTSALEHAKNYIIHGLKNEIVRDFGLTDSSPASNKSSSIVSDQRQ
jgi:hypothetical protein